MQVVFVQGNQQIKAKFDANTLLSDLYQHPTVKVHDQLFYYLVPIAKENEKTTVGDLWKEMQQLMRDEQDKVRADKCDCAREKMVVLPRHIPILIKPKTNMALWSQFKLVLKKLSVIGVLFS